jgi:hypothetical protein
MFPVSYELNFYTLFRINSVFKGLNIVEICSMISGIKHAEMKKGGQAEARYPHYVFTFWTVYKQRIKYALALIQIRMNLY